MRQEVIVVTNINLLKSKIIEKGFSTSDIIKHIDINKSTFYRKLSNDGKSFTVEEVYKISLALGLTASEVNNIFLD